MDPLPHTSWPWSQTTRGCECSARSPKRASPAAVREPRKELKGSHEDVDLNRTPEK